MNYFIIKGLLRDRSRSVFPVLVTAAGVFIAFLGLCFLRGMLEDLIQCNAWFDTGHVKIVSKAYSEDIQIRPLELYMDHSARDLSNRLSDHFPGFTWTKRLHFGGIIDIPDDQGHTFSQALTGAMAIDFLSTKSPWAKRLNIQKSLKKGACITEKNHILISKRLAQELKVKPESRATLICNTSQGASCSANFIISGIIEFGISSLDRGMILMDIDSAESFLDMKENRTAELLGFRQQGYDNKLIDSMVKKFNSGTDYTQNKFAPYALGLEDQNNLKEILSITRKMNFIAVGVFVFLMTLVLWNAGLISGLRRYSEIGVRLAIGEKRRHIILSMLAESLFTGLAGTLIGIAAAFPLVYYLEKHGIDYTEQMKNISIMVNSVVRAKITLKSAFLAMVPGLFSSFLGMMIASLGILKRQTASLFKELE
jgi:putative ABC transport system permease protein